jgi:S1-C subfamily serine protease
MVVHASQSVAMLTAITESSGAITQMMEGTSFCVDERGFFLTACHYVKGCTNSYIVFGGDIVSTMLVAVDQELDLALFVVKKLEHKFVPLHLSQAALEKNEVVIGLGFLPGLEGLSPAAFMAGYQGQLVNGADPQAPAVDCPALPSGAWFIGAGVELPDGFSGGPMLNEAGLVVAVTEMGDKNGLVVAGTTAADTLKFLAAHLH